MQIYTTPHELMERNLYDKAEDILGIKSYAIEEGLLDLHEQLTLTGKEAEEIGLIEERDNSWEGGIMLPNLDKITYKDISELSERELVEEIGWCVVHLNNLEERTKKVGSNFGLEPLTLNGEIKHYKAKKEELIKAHEEKFRGR